MSNKEKNVYVGACVDKKTRQKVKEIAEKNGVSISRLILMGLRDILPKLDEELDLEEFPEVYKVVKNEQAFGKFGG